MRVAHESSLASVASTVVPDDGWMVDRMSCHQGAARAAAWAVGHPKPLQVEVALCSPEPLDASYARNFAGGSPDRVRIELGGEVGQ